MTQPDTRITYDAQLKSTKDLLQTELSNTLKRRKPVAIVDPPKYQFPTLNDAENVVSESIKPINVSKTLAAVSPIKLLEGAEVIITRNDKITSNNKPMIGHVKPNFTLPRKRPEVFETNTATTAQATPKLSLSQNNASLEAQTLPGCDSRKKFGQEKSVVGQKLLMSHGKPNFRATSMTPKQYVAKVPCNQKGTKEAAENYLQVKIKSLKSSDESASSQIAEKKAIFEKLSPSTSGLDTNSLTSHTKQSRSVLNQLRNDDDPRHFSSTIQKAAARTDTSSENITNGCVPRAPNNNQLKHKTIVSFSKDLNDSPNRYPEHVRVTKTIITSDSETVENYRRQEAIFDHIRFSINDLAVVQKLK